MHSCVNLFTFHVVVLAALLRVKAIAKSHLMITKWDAENKLLDLIFDQCTSSEDVASTSDVLDMSECKKEAKMLTCT